jgi:hypothetical protein
MKCYTYSEFMRADFPTPDMEEEYSNLDLVHWNCREFAGAPNSMLWFITETSARLYQLRMGSGKTGPGGVVGNWKICTFCVATRDALSQQDVQLILDQLHPDSVMMDLLVLLPVVREEARRLARDLGESVQLGPQRH